MARVMKPKPTIDPRYPTNGKIHMLSSNSRSLEAKGRVIERGKGR